jgi:hypothetical protein
LSLNSFKSELKEFPFLSEEEKTNPPTQQTWGEIRNPKLRRHPDCEKILVEELINDHVNSFNNNVVRESEIVNNVPVLSETAC